VQYISLVELYENDEKYQQKCEPEKRKLSRKNKPPKKERKERNPVIKDSTTKFVFPTKLNEL
jgi:hypothetical protein